eukprot:tig00000826_g4575.t1
MERRRRRREALLRALAALSICSLFASASATALVVFTTPETRQQSNFNTAITTNRGTTYKVEFTVNGMSGTARLEVFEDGAGSAKYTLQTDWPFSDAAPNVFDWYFKPSDYPVTFSQKYYLRVRVNGAGNAGVTSTTQIFAPQAAPLKVEALSEARVFIGSSYKVFMSVAVPLAPRADSPGSPSIGIGIDKVSLHLCVQNATVAGGYACDAAPLQTLADPGWRADPSNAFKYIGSVEFTVPEREGPAFFVRVTSELDPESVGYTSLPFSISRDVLVAELPALLKANPALLPLSSHYLQWSMSAPSDVTIAFVAGADVTVLRTGLGQNGNATITVPFSAQGASAAAIRVLARRSGSTTETFKDIPCSVVAATVSLTSPAPGGYLEPGKTIRVAWQTSVPALRWTLAIENQGGAFRREVATDVSGTTYDLAVPKDLALSGGYLVLTPTDAAHRLPALTVPTPINIGEEPTVGLTATQKTVVIVVCVVGGTLLLVGLCGGAAWWYVRDQRTKIAQAKAMGMDMGEYRGFVGTLLAGAGNITARIGRSMRGISSRFREGVQSAGRSMRGGMRDAWGGGWTITKKRDGAAAAGDAAERIAAANRAEHVRSGGGGGGDGARVAPAPPPPPPAKTPPLLHVAAPPRAAYSTGAVSLQAPQAAPRCS